jgi:hypothetical protein
VDASPHRAGKASAYNSYLRVDADPGHDPAREDEQMLLRPLFYTSFLIDDFLDENGLFGAATVAISSASSKTALGVAFLLSRRKGVELVGLTSARSAGFVEGLDLYDRVVEYEDLSSLPRTPTAYVDMAGDAAVRAAVHEHYGVQLTHSAAVGATHWDAMAGGGELPGPRPEFFFAPDRIGKRTRDWGREGLAERYASAWKPFVAWSSGWLRIVHGSGSEAVEHAYVDLLDGRVDPSTGHALSLQA